MHLQESGEMYLETIYVLSKENGNVRSVGLLRQGGYLVMDKEGLLTLTESGKAAAEKIFERHTILTRMLIALGVDHATAAEDACKIEHVISDASFDAIKQYLDK